MGFKLFSDFKIKNGVLEKYRGKDSNVVIPSNVTTIGEKAFYECKTLTNITIPNSVTRIGDDTFWYCTSLKSITIPNSVTSIGNGAFFGCKSLQSITIPDSVTSIGEGICAMCTQLKQINVEEGNVNYISIDGNLYTKDGKTLVQYTIGKKDTSFTIPNSVTSIGSFAFYGCISLTSITIPSSVKSIDNYAFDGCKSLKTVYNLSKLDILKGARTHGYVAYYADNVYTELPNPDLEIKDGVLVKYKGKGGNVVIPNSVTTIGENAFNGCAPITNITIPNTVKKICDWAFDCCNDLTSIFIPASVEEIAGSDFARCSKLNAIKVDVNNKYYKSIDGNLYKKRSDGGIDLIQYAVGKKETTFTIPSEVKSVNFYAFWGNTSLKNIIANDKDGYFVTKDGNLYSNYGKRLFQYACGKTDAEFTIPEGVEEILNSGCSYCKHLKKVNLPSTLTKIGYNSFQCCENLQEIVIPASVTEIKKNAFSNCKNLKTVYNLSKLDIKKGAGTHGYVAYYADNVYTELPKTQSSSTATISDNRKVVSHNDLFSKYRNNGTIQSNQTKATSSTQPTQKVAESVNPDFEIKDGVLVKYKGKGGNVVIPSNVTTIGDCAFNVCTSLTSITIPNSVTSIGNGAFFGCKSLQSITIPDSVTSIGEGICICAMCTQLKQINVEEGNVNYISIDGNLYTKDGKTLVQYAIGRKDTSFTIPNSVTSIGNWAFNGCTSLTSITIPNSVTSIGYRAFLSCESLKTVYNLSKLDIQKGAGTHGYVAYYANNVYTELPKSIEQSKQSKIDKVDTQASDMLGNIPKDMVDKNKTKIVSTPDFVVNADGVLIEYKGSAEELIIPNGIKEIGTKVFEKNSKLVSITIADSVKRIWARAFDKCTSLKKVDLGGGVRYIGEYAFARCNSIEEITLPVSLVQIGKGAFERCSSLEEINNHSFIPLVDNQGTPDSDIFRKVNDDIMAFEENNYLANLVINDNVVTKYDEGENHSAIALPKGVKAIGSEAFANNDTLEEIHTPDSLVEIGYRAFENCSKLRKVVLGSELERISMRAFTKCASLEAIELPDTLKSIASWSFDDCTSLKEIVIPANVTAIEDGTFYGCTSLEKVTFLGKVQSIGAYAFDGCVALKEINLPKNCNVDETTFNNTTCKVIKK